MAKDVYKRQDLMSEYIFISRICPFFTALLRRVPSHLKPFFSRIRQEAALCANCLLYTSMSTLSAPDFPTGGELIYNQREMQNVYDNGRGSFKLRARWRYIREYNLIEIYEIPYTTTVEAIIDKVAELVKAGKVREISDMRDETDLNGLKLAIDLKRGTDPEKLMQKRCV